jgi:hypothetical protein
MASAIGYGYASKRVTAAALQDLCVAANSSATDEKALRHVWAAAIREDASPDAIEAVFRDVIHKALCGPFPAALPAVDVLCVMAGALACETRAALLEQAAGRDHCFFPAVLAKLRGPGAVWC